MSDWKLKAPLAGDTQGLVVSGFGSLPTGRALFLELGWSGQGGGAWLKALDGVARVTDADGKEPRSAAIAFTGSGIAKMTLPEAVLDSFAAPFREGMFQPDRLRRLGDRYDGDWLGTVIDEGPLWSGNAPQDDPGAPPPTAITVHALLLLYDKDEASADAWASQAGAALAPHGVAIVRQLPLALRLDEKNIAREHFGFADGISQPILFDAGMVDPPGPDPVNGIPLGDVLLGFANSHHEIAASPIAPPLASGIDTGLPPHPLAEGMLDLGRGGSYLVVRELRQDVAAFWTSLDKAAGDIRAADPGATEVTADWIAERVIGRKKDGELLCPLGTLAAPAGNDFGFWDRDRHGHGCPVGSHVRRANPRDGLSPGRGDKATLLAAANNHRILRRGRKYGPDIADVRIDDKADRGLLFMCLNTDIARQFEFVQQTWLLNSTFATLYDETDPLMGAKGKMTIKGRPVRRRIDVETYVRMAGGDYFFLPGMPALRYLAEL